jgi:hypothetical protein
MTVTSGGFNDNGIGGVGFPDAFAGDQGTMLISALKSLNFVSGVSGWQITKEGQAQFNELTLIVQSSGAAILIYANEAEFGTLIGSWAGTAGTDQFGNSYPSGISASQGTFTGLGIVNSEIVSTLINQCILTNAQIQSAAISGGTMVETVISFDTTGGALLAYATTTTVITHASSGTYQDTVPANVFNMRGQAWAAGAGGDGGNSTTGGNGGGAAEYAEEPQYPVVPGQVITTVVGDGGNGNITGQGHGGDGGDTIIDLANSGIMANGGNGDGTKGTGSTNTIHFDGGAGGASNSGDTGAAGGGGSAGATGAGGNGVSATGATGQNGGTAGTGGGAAGGKGGNNAANGSNGSAPGAGGGGAGAGSAVNAFNKTYTCQHSHSYQGSNGTNPNLKINDEGTSYQGGDVAHTFNGHAKTWFTFNKAQIQSDLTGVTITGVKATLNNNHTWYNSGMTVALGYDNQGSFGSSMADPSGGGIDAIEYHQNEGATLTKDVTNHGFGTAFQSGSDNCLVVFKNSSNLAYYGYFAGASQSGPAKIQFIGTTGGGTEQAGNGQDGQAILTYVSTATLVMSISPVAGTDQYGNAYPAGIMTSLPIQVKNQSAPSLVSGAALIYAAGANLKYISGGDGNAYNTGHTVAEASGTTTINSTSNIPITGTIVAVVAGTYLVRGYVHGTNGGTAATQAVSITGPAASNFNVEVDIRSATANSYKAFGEITSSGSRVGTAALAIGERFVATYSGIITFTASGNVQLGGSCVTAAADTWTADITSHLILEPVT